MKKALVFAGIFLTTLIRLQAQNGLEHIQVEKFYISDANDTVANIDGGVLPLGSVTYRVYADMLPGYEFQAAFGVPGHEMRIETSTYFFNNLDRGNTSPTFTLAQCASNTVMLDTYLSTGGSCSSCIAVPKTEDDSSNTIVNNYSPQVLQSTNADAGIPIKIVDGKFAGTPNAVTFVGITPDMFNDLNSNTAFVTSNGSWASLNGSRGHDTLLNKVLIAQITTNGQLSLKLNVQIRKITPLGPVVEKYVAENPIGDEIAFPELIYVSDTTSTSGIRFASDANPTWSVFPNPCHDFISLAFAGSQASEVQYQLYNAEGKKVLSNRIPAGTPQSKISLSGLPGGIYFLEVLSAENHISRSKLVRY